jgi:hypothetical protein
MDYTVMQKVEFDKYVAEDGAVMQREEGRTPNGNQIGGRWVLRAADGTWIGFNQYRHDLAAMHGYQLKG